RSSDLLLAFGDDLRRLAGAAGDRHAGGVLDRPADLLEGERFVRRTGIGAVGGEERGGGVAFGRDLEAAIGTARGDRERHHGDEQQGREAAQEGAGRGGAVGGVSAREVGMRPRGGLGGGAGAVFTARLGGLAGAKWARRLPGGVSRGGGHTFIFACS